MTDLEIPDTGAVFTFGKSRFAENKPSHFFIKNDPVVHIACGDEHTAVICKNGRIFAFGSNEWGQLGLGHNNMVHKPSCIKSLKPERAKYIACGRAHTIILTESNNIYACGSNTDGQLGLDNVDMVNTPTRLPHSVLYENETIRKLSAGSQHSAALTDSGKLFVWGSNSEGQLGIESSRSNCKQPILLELKDKIQDISCGYYHTAVITENGELYIFGENENGKLGIPQSENQAKPTKVNIDMPLSSITCGGNHNFVLTESGVAIAFGSNLNGELGLSKDVTWVAEPRELPASLFNDEKITMISCGENHTAFITESMKIFTCGDIRHGKLCHEEEEEADTESHTGPKQIKRFNNYNVTNVSCGGCHTIISAQKNEDEYNKTGMSSLPPLQRIPNSILSPDDAGHKISDLKAELIEPLDSAENHLDEISEKISSTTETTTNGIENIINEISSPVNEIKAEVENHMADISKIPDNISQTIMSQKGALENRYDKTLDKVEDQAETVTDNVTHKLDEIKTGIGSNIETLKTQAEDQIHEVKSGVNTWISSAEDTIKDTSAGITSGLNKFMHNSSDKNVKSEPKFDSVDDLLQEIEDDLSIKSSKSSSGDTVSIISNEKKSKELTHEMKIMGNGHESKTNINDEEDDVKVPTPPPEKRLTKFFNTFRRKKISSSTIELKSSEGVIDKEGSMNEIKEDTTESKTDKTKACIIL